MPDINYFLFHSGKSEIGQTFANMYKNALNSNNLPGTSISTNVSGFLVEPETNCFILSWRNPTVESFGYVQVRMSRATNQEDCNFEDSTIIYTGRGESLTFDIEPDSKQRDYFQFWIRAFAGSPVPTKGLDQWQTIG